MVLNFTNNFEGMGDFYFSQWKRKKKKKKQENEYFEITRMKLIFLKLQENEYKYWAICTAKDFQSYKRLCSGTIPVFLSSRLVFEFKQILSFLSIILEQIADFFCVGQTCDNFKMFESHFYNNIICLFLKVMNYYSTNLAFVELCLTKSQQQGCEFYLSNVWTSKSVWCCSVFLSFIFFFFFLLSRNKQVEMQKKKTKP